MVKGTYPDIVFRESVWSQMVGVQACTLQEAQKDPIAPPWIGSNLG